MQSDKFISTQDGWGAVSASGVIENGGDGEQVVLTLKDRQAEES